MPAIEYEELSGSPSYEIDRRGGSGKRSIKIAWSDLTDFVAEVFPDPHTTGYLYGATMPGAPWMVATKMAIKPFDDRQARYDVDEASWLGFYDFAQIDIDYKPPWDDQQQQSGSGDGTGPGGADGSSAGQDVTFLSHKVSLAGEFLTWPSNAVLWNDPANDPLAGAIPAPLRQVQLRSTVLLNNLVTSTRLIVERVNFPNAQLIVIESALSAEKMLVRGIRTNKNGTLTLTVQRGYGQTPLGNYPVGSVLFASSPAAGLEKDRWVADKEQCVVAVPLIEHSITWNYVAFPPWTAMRQCMGHVNAYWFAGAPPETVLFLGGECERDITSAGAKVWKMAYKLAEKNQNSFDPTRPMGWNYFLRPSGASAGQFQRLSRRVRTTAGAYVMTNVTDPMNNTQTAMFADDVSALRGWPQQGQFFIRIDNEILAVTAKISVPGPSGGNWAIIRGVQGTTPAFHAAGSEIQQVPGGVYDVADFRYLFLTV